MKKFFLYLSLFLIPVVGVRASQVSYTADDHSIFPNPERGFLVEYDRVVAADKPYAIYGHEEEIQQYMAENQLSLVLAMYYLDNFRTTNQLPEYVLTAFDKDMQCLRDLGLKCILRFAYTKETYTKKGVESAKDAELSVVLSHIAQLKPHLMQNADVIYTLEAGFIGAWGEWYYTDHFGNQAHEMNDDRREVVDSLLAALPADRCVLLRTPLFKTGYVGDTHALTEEEAYQNTPRARLGHHNDAFLYGPKNQGTYRDTATQKPYVAQETLFVPIGGESDITDAGDAAEWASYEETTKEMSRLHWSFISCVYTPAVINQWRSEGTFEELNRKLGYRLQLVEGSFSDEVEQGRKMAVQLKIRNTGYAPLYNYRPAYIVLKSSQHSDISIQLKADPRRWEPNGVVSVVDEELVLPEDVPEGTYQLYLALPDAYGSLAGDPRYAVRFANEDIWDQNTGLNHLAAQVSVVQAQTPPEPPTPPEPEDGIVLPNVLNKANVTAYSDDMTWYEEDYFDFGPTDAENLERWAEWEVELRYPGKYKVSENMASAWVESEGGLSLLGHSWKVELLKGNIVVSEYQTAETWEEGELSYDDLWDLTNVPKDTYTLRVQNVEAWGQPKLKCLTLSYDGELPTGMEDVSHQHSDVSPKKMIQDGIFYILMPDGKKVYSF